MSPEKRKGTDEWTNATLFQDGDRRGVYLASFSGVRPPPTTTFREYKRIRKDRRDEKDVILQGETERIEFEGRTKSKDNDDTCKYQIPLELSNSRYAIGIYNPEKGSVKLIPAPMLQMQRSIKALKSRAGKTLPQTPSQVHLFPTTPLIADPRATSGPWRGLRVKTCQSCDRIPARQSNRLQGPRKCCFPNLCQCQSGHG